MAAPATQRRPPPAERLAVGAPLPLRIAFFGRRARELFGIGIEAVAARRGAGLDGVDAVVFDERAPRGGLRVIGRLARAAREAGVPVVGLRRGAEAEPAWSGLAELEIGAAPQDGAPSLATAAPVDPRAYNPLGFVGAEVAGFGAVITSTGARARLEPAIRWLGEASAGEPVRIMAPRGAELPPAPAAVHRWSGPPSAELVARLRKRVGVLDHPGFHRSAWERANLLVRLCAAGVPVVAAEIDTTLVRLLGGDLAEVLGEVEPGELSNTDLREELSVRLRRAALRHHSGQARWREIAAALGIEIPPPPLVSVVLATRRQEWLEHGISQVLRQTYEPRELIVCLHGEEFSDDVEARIRTQARARTKVLRIDGELTLGEALNAGVEVAEGDVVTKMDDDDYYTVDHLWDLVQAIEYSGAELVGKGAEFVYVSTVDLTIRRFIGGGETDHPRLGGGVMMARREPLVAIGGWPARNRGEDGMLVKNFKAAGRRTHRMHGFGYILNRHMRGHTWNTYADYFLVQSQREWRGLRFDVTGIERGAEGLEPDGAKLEPTYGPQQQASEAPQPPAAAPPDSGGDIPRERGSAPELARPPLDPP